MNAPQRIASGVLVQKLRRHWWQFWLPREVVVATWIYVGDVMQVTMTCGALFHAKSWAIYPGAQG